VSQDALDWIRMAWPSIEENMKAKDLATARKDARTDADALGATEIVAIAVSAEACLPSLS
jgi:hypothetical protein